MVLLLLQLTLCICEFYIYGFIQPQIENIKK